MKISQHCYAITGLAFIPPWTVNAGFIAGVTTTLIVDTGATMQSARTIYGYASCVRPQNRLLVINTERHLDHVSGNSLFRDQDIDVYGHCGIARTDEELAEAITELNACIPGQRLPTKPGSGRPGRVAHLARLAGRYRGACT
jgi:glyoxylase-like metal-dependent hydrolase (beta-lactamase superfamily II)